MLYICWALGIGELPGNALKSATRTRDVFAACPRQNDGQPSIKIDANPSFCSCPSSKQFLLVDELNMRSSSAFYILLASGRLFCIPVRALPCIQKSFLSSSPYPGCRMSLNSRSGTAINSITLNELSTNTSPQQNSSANAYLTPTLALTLFLFILTASLLIVLFFFTPNIRSFLLQKTKKEEKPNFGFGFDGLTKQELKGLRLKEEQAAVSTNWLTKVPVRPPALVLKHPYSPILPIQLDDERSGMNSLPVEDLCHHSVNSE
jgi:hypothetical protein